MPMCLYTEKDNARSLANIRGIELEVGKRENYSEADWSAMYRESRLD